MTMRRALGALVGLVLLSGCAATGASHGAAPGAISHPEGAIFDPTIDATSAVDAALAKAAEEDKLVLLVMGANWCHDSRALTSYLMEPELAAVLDAHFHPVYVNVGLPQTGDGYNLHIAERFGVTPDGTPNVLVLNGDGELINTPEDAVSWRNSASRSLADVQSALESWTDL